MSLQRAVYVAIVHVTASRCAGPTEFVKLCEGALQAAGCVGRLSSRVGCDNLADRTCTGSSSRRRALHH